MFYLVGGSDTKKSHEQFQKIISNFLKKDGLNFFKLDEDSFDESFFNGLLKTSSLFGGKNLVAAKRLFSSAPDYFLKNSDKLSSSGHIFVFLEEDLKKEGLKDFKGKAEEVVEFNFEPKLKNKKGNKNNLFKFADTLASRKKEQTWLVFQKEILNGTSVEDLFFKCVWQIKTLFLVKKNIKEGMHPFVYQKNKNAANLFSFDELKKYSGELVGLYHLARNGKADLAVGLEKFILRV